jgi:aminocarboxymuconate-semialdehyde decarboxylase
VKVGLLDCHAHVVLEASLGRAGACGPEIGVHPDGTPWFRVCGWRLDGVPYRGSVFMDPELRIERMDRDGIAVQALSPNPLTYFHHLPIAPALEYCRAHNDDLAATVERHPDRLLGLAALPAQDPAVAAAELARAVGELGLVGGYLGTDLGRPLDAPELDELYGAAVELDVPLFLHPAPSGLDGPSRDDRLRRFDLDLVLEFAHEEALAVASLVFGGVTRRHPSLDVCLSHGGGSLPLLLAKLRRLAERRPSSPEWLRQPGAFDAAVGGLWFDAHVTGGAEQHFAVGQLGEERLVFGTNFGGWDDDPGHRTLADTTVARLTANGARLLRLAARRPALLARLGLETPA